MKKYNKFQSGLYGLLIGDALGVPYEFHSAAEIPSYSDIEMNPPSGFERAHRGVEPGTWSDDGAQALCLLDSIITCGKFDLKDFSDKLLSWYQEGKWAVDGMVFDIGIQTGEALMAYKSGMAPEKCGMVRPNGKGNGALMRTLPLALWHNGTDKELVIDAHSQCLITHGNICNQVCCALYCLVARSLLNDSDFDQALENAIQVLRNIYREMPVTVQVGLHTPLCRPYKRIKQEGNGVIYMRSLPHSVTEQPLAELLQMPEYEQELEWSVRPDEPWEGSGSGYVVDCLRSAFMIMKHATSYEEAVKQAIMLGDDTDTTACVTGGLAGILFGFENIPSRWYNALRGKENVENLIMLLKGE